jgi:hypothetical protein
MKQALAFGRRYGLAALVATMASHSMGDARAQSYNEMMSEASAQEFYQDVQRRISASTHDGPTYYLTGDYSLTPEQEKYLEEQRQNDEKLNELRKDPVLMRHVNGYWEHYQAREPAKPGEFCASTYTNLHGTITLNGVDDRWEGGLLTFIGKDIPTPDAFREITATLTQSGDRSVTVRIYNPPSSPEMKGLGTLIFAVPNMKAALSGMKKEQEFAISIDGREVFRMGWKDGIEARNSLRNCMDKRSTSRR